MRRRVDALRAYDAQVQADRELTTSIRLGEAPGARPRAGLSKDELRVKLAKARAAATSGMRQAPKDSKDGGEGGKDKGKGKGKGKK